MRAEKTLKKCFRNPPCGQEKRLKRVFLADFESFDRNGGAPATPRAAEPGPHRFDQMLDLYGRNERPSKKILLFF